MTTIEQPLWYYATRDERADVIHGLLSDVKMSYEGGIYTSRSGGHPTKEALYAAEHMLENCSECGVEAFSTNWCEPLKSTLIRDHVCFTCQFWREKLVMRDDPGTARVQGQHYRFDAIQPMASGTDRWRGFGGRDFEIHFKDGRVVKTNNLWSQGPIPPRWHDRLPDNATFHWPEPVGHGQGFLS